MFLEVVFMLLYIGMGNGGSISLGAENARVTHKILVQNYIYISNNQLALRFEHSAKAFTQFLSGLLCLCRIKNTSALCNPISNESSVFKGFYRVVEFIMLYKGRIVTINFNSWRIKPYYITNYTAAAKLSKVTDNIASYYSQAHYVSNFMFVDENPSVSTAFKWMILKIQFKCMEFCQERG